MTDQDPEIRHPTARLRTVLTLTRLLAGRRGHSEVTWHGQGFTYVLTARRDPAADPAVVQIDADLGEEAGGFELGDPGPQIAQLAELLEVRP